MNKDDFHAPQAGQAVFSPRGYWTFIPAPLPPDISYDPHLVLALSRADVALSELSGLGRHIINPHLLIASYIRKEAVLSSRIEGTRAGIADLLLDDLETPGNASSSADLREVQNYVTALEYGIDRLNSLPLSLRLVREIHARLMEGVRGGNATPGEVRRSQNWIGTAGSTLANAPYVPPPADEMKACLTNWELFLQDRGSFPELIQCALLHEQFEAIHPFLDGNGRIGRLLITLFLIERGRLSQPLLYLSAYIEAHRQDYYDLLQRVRTHGDWNSWLQYFLHGVEETSKQAVRQAGALMDLREQLHIEIRSKPKAAALVDSLFTNPYMTVSRAAELLNVSLPTARQVVKVLEESGVLQEVTGRAWGKTYVATRILRLIVNSTE
ncbi:MAG: Fic family protein [Chloroflexi bacterium]|nr:MAG: Fic family protein [Chloroflexota bacterium]